MSFGPVTTRAVGPVKPPVTMQGPYSAVTGVYGASFTSVAVQLVASSFNADQLDRNQTMMTLSINGVPYPYDLGSSQITRVDASIPQFANDCAASISPSGEKIVASLWTP